MTVRPTLRPFEAGIFAILIFTLPFLFLIPLGYFWLFEHGWSWLLAWTLGAVIAAAAARLIWRRSTQTPAPADPTALTPPDPAWSPKDDAAWATVINLTADADASTVTSAEQFVKRAQAVIEAVASHYRSGDERAIWGFTIPEALLLTERISHDMRSLVAKSIPFVDRITVGIALHAYGWMPHLQKARKFYDLSYNLYRLYRIIPNIALAGANEIRTKLTLELFLPAIEATKTKLIRLLLNEIGRAAIDLYSGRLRLSDHDFAIYATTAARSDASREPPPREPIRILLAGQINAGKSSLINALTSDVQAGVDILPATAGFTTYQISRDGLPAAVLVDGPGLSGEQQIVEQLIAQAADSDIIIWVAQAHRPARSIDHDALDRFRRYFAGRPDRRQPPMILVLSHIDCLRPYAEWAPPYDLRAAEFPKARSIAAAITAISADLSFDPAQVVPVCLSVERGYYNIDAVWAFLLRAVPQAQQAQINRILTEAQARIDWSRVWSQTLGGLQKIGKFGSEG